MAASESHQTKNTPNLRENMIGTIITSLHHQSHPIIEKLKESVIDDEQMKQILKQYWTPTERLRKSAERIQVTSLHKPTSSPEDSGTGSSTRSLPPPPEEDAIRKLSNEIGTDVRELYRQIAVMFEMLPEKVNELNTLESDLKAADVIIERFHKMIDTIDKELNCFCQLVPTGTIPPEYDFFEVLNMNVIRHLVEGDIPAKLERYQFLLEQIALIRSFVELIHQRVTIASPDQEGERLPVCKVCLDAKADFIMIPCGHLSCEVCMNRMNSVNSRCYFCRRNVTDIIKVYY